MEFGIRNSEFGIPTPPPITTPGGWVETQNSKLKTQNSDWAATQ